MQAPPRIVPVGLSKVRASRRNSLSAASLSLLVVAATAQEPRESSSASGSEGPAAVFAFGSAYPQRMHQRKHPAAIDAIDSGIRWLSKYQSEDGRWDADEFMPGDQEIGPGKAPRDVAITGLALLACAREGRPQAREDQFQLLIKGIRWLTAQQEGSGRLGPGAVHDFIYDHAIGTLGLLAATAATESEEGRDAAELALAYLQRHRNPHRVWRYLPRDGDNDTSVTTWCTLACAGAHELGIGVDEKVFSHVGVWLEDITDDEGRSGYTSRGSLSSRLPGEHAKKFPVGRCETLTGAGVLCRAVLGDADHEDSMKLSTSLLLQSPPQWEPEEGLVDFCYWFFASEGLRHRGGDAATTWRKQMVAAVSQGQHKDGKFAGSWDPVGPWGEQGGRVYATAMAVLALQSIYPFEQD
ncbi:MAG: prenyltransferase/squalene oxidase repeat-containing protein [Planctomycetota bacterium]|nr:prenyltransferase/squalene oxidase repeat-containing protein [Planctomycetota bacterium]